MDAADAAADAVAGLSLYLFILRENRFNKASNPVGRLPKNPVGLPKGAHLPRLAVERREGLALVCQT